LIRRKRAQAIIFSAGKILMVRHNDLFIGKQYWCLPGGGIEAGETPEQAVIRELMEETGLQISLIRKIAEESFPEVSQGYAATITFLAKVVEGKLRLGYDPEQADWKIKFLQEVKWLPLEGEKFTQLDRFFFRERN
jgi:8-oxo-dGTP diphosphatase